MDNRTINCSKCKTVFNISLNMVGKKYKCKICGEIVSIPVNFFSESAEIEYKKHQNLNNESFSSTTKNRRYLNIAIAVIGVVLISVLGIKFGYHQYKVFKLKEKLEEAIGKNLGYTETILKIEAEASNMTYKELFDLCYKSIQDRTNLVIELRGLYPDINYELKEKLVNFLNDENILVRAKRAFYRSSMGFSSAMKSYTDHISDTPSSSFAREYYLKRSVSLKNELLKEIGDILSSSEDFKTNYNKLCKQENEISNMMKSEGLRFPLLFQNFQSHNLNAVEKAKSIAEKFKKELI